MEENKKPTLLSPEEIKIEKRKKQLAIIKASNEMLAQAKENVLKTDKIDEVSRSARVNELNQAIEENLMRAKTYLNASSEELENIQYGEASDAEKKKYQERLEKRGLTEEDIKHPDAATVVKNTAKSKRKRPLNRKTKKDNIVGDEVIERVPNEEEWMKRTMASDKDIEEKLKSSNKPEDKFDKQVNELITDKKITENKASETNVEVVRKKRETLSVPAYDFDFSSIPDYVQYDVIPLPSKGECYPINSPLRHGRVPVAMLTAADENIIASPNMYRDGKIIDVILSRKILDKRIDITTLCKGDRDAIVLWLRATGYDTEFPIVATHPVTGKKYDVNVKLDELEYRKTSSLKSDDEGNFTYKMPNGDILKYNFTTQLMEDEFKNKVLNQNVNSEKINLNTYLNNIENCISNITDFSDSDITDIKSCIDDIKDILNETVKDDVVDENQIFANAITEKMILYTKSVNGITDKNYIQKYIENMRSNDAFHYREAVNNNTPGVNFEININVPESDGGGSFVTFLKIGNDVFLNI